MTNPKSRQTGKVTAKSKLRGSPEAVSGTDEPDGGADPEWLRYRRDEYALTEPSEWTDVDEESGELDDGDTATSFSLQECMDEFRARRHRRNSTHKSEEAERGQATGKCRDSSEMDLINQNLCNKEQERRCKPCKDGFCYCFTSDSGDGGGSVAGTSACKAGRITHVRQQRRQRRSDGGQVFETIKEHRLSSSEKKNIASSSFSSKATDSPGPNISGSTVVQQSPLTAISRLETSHKDAPLIHIIQELRDNCVVSEVRVNKHKLEAQRRAQNKQKMSEPQTILRKKQFNDIEKCKSSGFQPSYEPQTPSAPPQEPEAPSAPPLDSFSDASVLHEESIISTKLEGSAKERIGPRHRNGGKLLQKRLSGKSFNFKPAQEGRPPPKPPRVSLSAEDKSSGSTTSTPLSVQEAERVVNKFLKEQGLQVPGKEGRSKQRSDTKKGLEEIKRTNTRLTTEAAKHHNTRQATPTYPSLKDLECEVVKKKHSYYDRNIRKVSDSQPKVHRVGWNAPKINDMLNCDTSASHKEFRSTACQAEPQQQICANQIGGDEIGWRQPHKIDLDTVDSGVTPNLATNVQNKNTPIKESLRTPKKRSGVASQTQKFIWSEQLKNLTPWQNKKTSGSSRKGNLRSNSKAFLKSSKKKILRLVSPKKENKERQNMLIRKTPFRHVAIQTSREELNSNAFLQSPPGSYHSPIQSCPLPSTSSNQSPNMPVDPRSTQFDFDFSRHVHSPPKKSTRSSQRKLNFPLNCARPCNGELPSPPIRTYHSYNEELDPDVSLSKMSYILSNIRARLEAEDDHAVRTFRETDRRSRTRDEISFDCVDGHHAPSRSALNSNVNAHHAGIELSRQIHHSNDPIYSEIDEESILFSESPNFENHTGIQHFSPKRNPDVVYAQVNKNNKRETQSKLCSESGTALGQILHESLKGKRTKGGLMPTLSPLPEPPGGEIVSYTSGASLCERLAPSCSLNNVRVMEQNSPPKQQRNLSKSDISLHRSEIFLENLCKSELRVDTSYERLQKVENSPLKPIYKAMNFVAENATEDEAPSNTEDEHSKDNVSYELPGDYASHSSLSLTFAAGGSANDIAPPSSLNQSTPKKPSFTTKDDELERCLSRSEEDHHSNSCPSSPSKNVSAEQGERCQSFGGRTAGGSGFPVLRQMKSAIRKSFRRGKQFFVTESKRLSQSLSSSNSHSKGLDVVPDASAMGQSPTFGSSFGLESLFELNQTAPVKEQLSKVVHICRQLPDLEISSEMVEAERLLLFSELRRGNKDKLMPLSYHHTMSKQPKQFVYVDDMHLPTMPDVTQDIFFNYFYIVTFECGGIIRSTQSAECRNNVAIFRDCGIEFMFRAEEDDPAQSTIRCNVFMLRLRKVSTLSMEPSKKRLNESLAARGSSSESSSSLNEIVSRFRLQASFTLDARNFAPYEYVEHESKGSDRLCLRASRLCKVPLTACTKSSNLTEELQLKGRAEVRFPKVTHNGFLNVEDPYAHHNWNRRWCSLDGIMLNVWSDISHLNESPLMSLNLCQHRNPQIQIAPKDLCARSRSFCIEGLIEKAEKETATASVFFAADTQEELDKWMEQLNMALEFINCWMI